MKFFNIFNIIKFINYIKNTISYTFSIIFKKYYIYGKPSFVSFELSSVCNLRCPQCDVGNRLTKRNNMFLDFNNYCKIIDQLGPTMIDAIFYFQGEPLLNNNFYKYISYAKIYNIYAITSTNAQLLNEEIAKNIVLSGLDKIIISIDGTTEEVYQKYRRGGTLKKAIDSIKILSDVKNSYKSGTPVIEAQFIVFSFNEHQIDEFKKLAPVWGADKVSIKSAQICNPDDDYALMPNNKKYCRYKKVDGHWVIKKGFKRACFRAWTGMVVSADMNILPCCFDKTENHIYGNFKDTCDAISIWKGDAANKFRSSLLKNRSSFGMCRNCNE